MQRFPVSDRFVPFIALGCKRAAFEIAEHSFIRRNQASARTRFNAHIADGQALFDTHLFEHRTAIFDHVACATGCADCADDMQDQVFRGHPFAKFAFNPHLHRFGALQLQRLRRQNMFDFAGADAKGQRANPAVAGGVRVAANNGCAGQREALFRPDNMHNSLSSGRGIDVTDAECGCIGFKSLKLLRAHRISDGNALTACIDPRRSGQVVVWHS